MTLIGLKNVVWMGGLSVIERFTSLYESFQALTSVQVSHFVEWFSGSVLDSIWTTSFSSGSGAMDDSIDGGYSITTSGTSDNHIEFNDKRHYSATSAIIIGVTKVTNFVDNHNSFFVGFHGAADINTQSSIAGQASNVSSFYVLDTADATTRSRTNSDIAEDTNFHVHKIELTASNNKYTIDGVLKVTKTTNLPTTKLQPFFQVQRVGAPANEFSGNIRYLEAFNTSVTILSSLYERLSALTQVIRQRVVETFQGSVINERWTENVVSGTATFGMIVAVDEGFQIEITSTTNFNRSVIQSNNKRQYDFDDSVIIGIVKRNTANTQSEFGFSGDTDRSALSAAIVTDDSLSTFKALFTDDGTSDSTTNSSVAVDTNFTNYKIETGASDVKLSINGILEVTKTTNRPTTKLQPFFGCESRSAASGKQSRIRYLEAYNKLGTETDHPSVYELFNKLTTVAKAHFWDWFDGSILNNRWTVTQIQTTGTATIEDTIDGGVVIEITGAFNSDRTSINFNDKRQYEETACVLIGVVKRQTTNTLYSLALSDDPDPAVGANNFAETVDDTASTFKYLATKDGTTRTQTNSSIAIDTTFHSNKIECSSADVKLTIDGVLEVTKTTNRPSVPLQPVFTAQSRSAAAGHKTNIRYMEVLNT